MSNNKVVDLTEIASKNQASFTVKAEGSEYYYNPCNPFTETGSSSKCDSAHDVAVCQSNGGLMYNAGRQESATFTVKDDILMVNYTSNHDDDPSYIRRTAVILKCDENEEGSLTFISTFPNVNEKYTNYVLPTLPSALLSVSFCLVTLTSFF
jgi:hypothetical protein